MVLRLTAARPARSSEATVFQFNASSSRSDIGRRRASMTASGTASGSRTATGSLASTGRGGSADDPTRGAYRDRRPHDDDGRTPYLSSPPSFSSETVRPPRSPPGPAPRPPSSELEPDSARAARIMYVTRTPPAPHAPASPPQRRRRAHRGIAESPSHRRSQPLERKKPRRTGASQRVERTWRRTNQPPIVGPPSLAIGAAC